MITPSSGIVPFGFGITRRGDIVISEAAPGTVSSYRLGASGALRAITPSLAVGQGAPCWVAVSPDGRFAYTGNASGSISGFAIGRDGSLTALPVTVPLPAARDLAFDRSGRYLMAVSPGNATTAAQAVSYRVGRDGSLALVGSAPAAAGITGAAAR